MNRNYIHDIKPSSRTHKHREALELEQSLRAKKLSGARPQARPVKEEYAYDGYREPRSPGRGIWYVAGLAILILVFALTYVFAGATVHVTPREGSVELTGPLVAEKVAKTGLSFQMLVIEDVASATVASTGEVMVEKKATGTVRLFNNHSTAPQKLLIDTRLLAPNGNIYKTKVATTIPGQKTVGGKLTPGTVDVEIYADQPGESYNATELDLKILGFKGGPKYDTIYARTTTEIKGGFKGQSSNVSEEDLKTETEKLKAQLSTSLVEKARAQLPEDFIMYDNVAVTDFADPVVTTSGDGGSATIKQQATMNAIIFKESDLTKALVSGVVAETDREKVAVSNIRELNIELDPAYAIGDPATMTSIKINISDKIQVVWLVSEEELKTALAGIKKRDFESKMLQFKNIDKAELGLKPFWKSRLPEKPSAIKIINTYEQTNLDPEPFN